MMLVLNFAVHLRSSQFSDPNFVYSVHMHMSVSVTTFLTDVSRTGGDNLTKDVTDYISELFETLLGTRVKIS